MLRKNVIRAALALCVALTLAAAALAAPFAKNRATAVILYDVDSGNRYSSVSVWDRFGGASYTQEGSGVRGAALATETIRSELVRLGYKIVSDRITADIVRAQPKPGGSASVKALSRKFGVNQYLDGSVQLLDTTPNALGMYSGAASVMVHGYDRTGRTVFSHSVTSKAVGITADEAEINAVRDAALKVAEKLTGVSSNPDAADGGMYVWLYGVRDFQTVKSVLTACKSTYGVDSASVKRYEGDEAMLSVLGHFNVSELQSAITGKVPYARITESNDHTIYVYMR